MVGPTSQRKLAVSALALYVRLRVTLADPFESFTIEEQRTHNQTIDALRDFYDQTGGRYWSVSASTQWFPDKPSGFEQFDHLAHCSWHGVVCCYSDAAVDAAAQAGALLSLGRTGWRHHAHLGALYDADQETERPPDFGDGGQILDCPHPGAVIALQLDGVGLLGTLPRGLHRLPLQYVSIADNPGLHGAIPLDIATPALWHLHFQNTSLNCHGDRLTEDGVIALAKRLRRTPRESWPGARFSPPERACVAAMGFAHAGWGVATPERGMSCQLRFLKGSNALLPPTYVLGVGCECRAATTTVLRAPGGLAQILCRDFQFMWIVETVTFGIMMLYVFAVLYHVADANKDVYMEWVKQRSQPGTLRIEGGSMQVLSWRAGLAGLWRARFGSARRVHYPCYIAMCTVRDLPAVAAALPREEVEAALRCYRRTLLLDLHEFSGWQVLHAASAARGDASLMVFAFHRHADALAWAMRAHHSLLHAAWPGALAAAEAARTIHHRAPGGLWTKLFAGLRVATAINKQMLSSASRVVGRGKTVRVESARMADLSELLALTNVCQVVTDEGIRTLEDIRSRLGIVSMHEASISARQMRSLTDHASGSGTHVVRNMLFTLRKFEDQKLASSSELAGVLAPVLIDLGKHVVRQPSRHPTHGSIVSIQQLVPHALQHQAYVAGLRRIPSLVCVQPPFWDAPGARAFASGAAGLRVVMLFACFADYQTLFQRGQQRVAEDAVELFKACVLQTLEYCGGYECQEVSGVHMLTFPTPTAALRWHLALQQLLLVADWTPAMLRLPPLRPEWGPGGELLHRGPRVKTGVYCGAPRTVNTHGTTGRADYWGELVNRAARMMSAAKGGQLLCTADLLAEALEALSDAPASPDAWELTSYRGNGNEVTVRRGGGEPRPCEPRVPSQLRDEDCPEALSRRWLGERLHAVCAHLPHCGYEGRESDGSTLADDGAALDENAPEMAHEYAHMVEVHDVGRYAFKGVAHAFSIKSVNAAALEGRNEAFAAELKATKATKLSNGLGFERAFRLMLPSPAMAAERLRRQSAARLDGLGTDAMLFRNPTLEPRRLGALGNARSSLPRYLPSGANVSVLDKMTWVSKKP